MPIAKMGLREIRLYLERMASKSLTFMVLTKVFFSAVTVPLIAFLLGSLFSFSGRKMALDWGFLNLVESFPEIAIFLTVAFLWLLCFSFEQSGLVKFSSAALKNSEERLISVLTRILRIFPRLLGLASFKAGILLLCTVPALRILPAMQRTFARQLPVGTYPSAGTGIFGWIAAMASLLVVSRLLISWVFAIHYAVLEGKTFVGSLMASTDLVNGSRKRVLLTMLAFWPLSLLLIMANSIVFRISRDFVIRSSYDPTSMNILKLSVFASVETMITTALSIGVSVIYSILMTRLFYELKEGDGDHQAATVKNPGKTKSLTLQRPWILPLLIFLVIQGVFFGYVGRFLVDTEIELPLVTAHRGSSFKAPENSLSSIRAAFEDGADIIEIDVQMTRDGILVLNHDRSLTKVAGVGERVHNLTFAEIADLDIGSRFSGQFSGERIPTLAEVITYMAEIPSSVKLNVEIKDYGYSPGISQAIVRLIKEMNFSDRVMITSTSIERLSAVRELAPDIPIGLI
ncbi:MAG: hypothetical protein JW701_06680, partial [Kosmotogaceae bacterium]|nr:hypothetical protein [Kosmotogaceae bacterium]